MKKYIVSLVVSLLVVFYPMAALAATDTTTNHTTGPTSPTGADANTYTYDEATGTWVNDHYRWDPATGKTTPLEEPKYTYNEETETWNTDEWQYNAATQKYEAVPKPVPTPPQQPASTSTSTTNNTNNLGLNNSVSSTATTGNASVSANTTGGSATSGSATASANIINVLQSSFAAAGADGTVVTFTANIPNSVTGDLYIDPGSIAQNQGASSNNPLQGSQSVTVNNQTNGQINNDVLLNATSGDAAVVANTTGGSATSGDAAAMANIVNIMNSSVAAGQSFVGTINIQGDLVGNILLPEGFLDSLVASNNNNSSTNTDSTLTNTNNQSINNNVSASATSGAADVTRNTTAGDATSGSATNTLTVLNLTGSNVIGNNALLVFVNVGGTWMGLIVNAPGSNSAMLGGGISQNTSSSPALVPTATESTIENTNNMGITNNITVGAQTGDATVSNNTTGGDATSGDASTSVNIANIVDSQMSFAGWFGVLFINILGNWQGNFGGSPTTTVDSTTPPASSPAEQVFQFVSTAAGDGGGSRQAATTARQAGTNDDAGTQAPAITTAAASPQVLGVSTDDQGSDNEDMVQITNDRFSLVMAAIGLGLGTLLLFGGNRLVTLLKRG